MIAQKYQLKEEEEEDMKIDSFVEETPQLSITNGAEKAEEQLYGIIDIFLEKTGQKPSITNDTEKAEEQLYIVLGKTPQQPSITNDEKAEE